MEKYDGGPAFGHGDPTHGGHSGMTLRDWFAGQALAGDMATYTQTCADEYAAQIAARAYIIADAMLKAREQ